MSHHTLYSYYFSHYQSYVCLQSCDIHTHSIPLTRYTLSYSYHTMPMSHVVSYLRLYTIQLHSLYLVYICIYLYILIYIIIYLYILIYICIFFEKFACFLHFFSVYEKIYYFHLQTFYIFIIFII